MGKISSSTFYANKEHFDSRLIEALSQRDKEIIKLKDIIYKKNLFCEKTKEDKLILSKSLKEVKEAYKLLSKEKKKQDKEVEDFKKKIDELEKLIKEKSYEIDILKKEIEDTIHDKDEKIKELNIRIKKEASPQCVGKITYHSCLI